MQQGSSYFGVFTPGGLCAQNAVAFHAYGVACRHFAGGPDPATPLTYPEVYAAGGHPRLLFALKASPCHLPQLKQNTAGTVAFCRPCPCVAFHVRCTSPGVLQPRPCWFMHTPQHVTMLCTPDLKPMMYGRQIPSLVQGSASVPID